MHRHKANNSVFSELVKGWGFVMDVCIREPLCCWQPWLWSLISHRKCVSLFTKERLVTTCLLNVRRQHETAIYQHNRQQYVSAHRDEKSQRSSGRYCCTIWEMYKRGAFDQITNSIQMSLQMLSSWLLFGIERRLWLLSALRLQWNATAVDPTCWLLACALPPETPKAEVKIDFRWPCYLYLAVSDFNYWPASWEPPHGWGVKLWFTHYRGEIWAAITYSSCLEKAQKASLLLVASSLTHWWNPPLHRSLPLLCRSQSVSRYLCSGELLFFHLKVYTHTHKKRERHPPPGPSHSSILDFIPSHSSLYVCLLLSSSSATSYPPSNSLPTLPASFFLPHSFPGLSVSLWFSCVCAGWTAGGAELVGEAENGLGSQNPGSLLMGGLARLPAASVHQLRPIIWRGHIWPGLDRLGLLGTSVWSLKTPPSFLQRRDDGVLAARKAETISQLIY